MTLLTDKSSQDAIIDQDELHRRMLEHREIMVVVGFLLKEWRGEDKLEKQVFHKAVCLQT